MVTTPASIPIVRLGQVTHLSSAKAHTDYYLHILIKVPTGRKLPGPNKLLNHDGEVLRQFAVSGKGLTIMDQFNVFDHSNNVHFPFI